MKSQLFKIVCAVFIFFSLVMPISDTRAAETWKTITPTDVWYLAKSIDESMAAMYGLKSVLTKKPISNNLRPRNVYQKVLNVADEFNLLHNGAISSFERNEAGNVNASRTKPADVYQVLGMIQKYFAEENAFTESSEERVPKSPGDVFHILRQISMHHYEIATQKNLTTDWASPARVYDAVVTGILPVLYETAKEAGSEYKPYPFPMQPVSGVIPRHVYKLLSQVYKNISEHYMRKGEYDPVILVEMNDCDDLSPADVFDVTNIIIAELAAKSGRKALPSEMSGAYSRWKTEKEKVVPGDVFRLIQHNFILTKKVLKK